MTHSAERRRTGSRLLLAAALVCGLVAAFVVGAGAGGLAADLVGVSSSAVRALLQLAGVVIVLPAGFYVVERFFLVRSARRAGGGSGPGR